MSSDVLDRSFSTRELQAAATALIAGQFTDHTAPGADSAVDNHGRQRATAHGAPSTALGLEQLVRVRAANAGAGASTIALALADVADATGARVRLLDAAAPAWSGLFGSTTTELGATEGWRRGRRGTNVLIDRVADAVEIPAQVPAPRLVEGIDLTVLDTGWSMRELAAAYGGWVAATPARAEVLVTRAHTLALGQTEAALTELAAPMAAGRVLVVLVGQSRWNERDLTAAGPRLRELNDRGAVLFAPHLTSKALPGLGTEALPKQLISSAQRLLERVTTITGPLSAGRP